MAIKVSVIVPVFNPGRHIDELLASLDRQSLPREEFEVLFVDDGSTDGTPERLESWVVDRPNCRVVRLEPSGGPGRPRNEGVRVAQGEYVQFVDNDDHLGDEALERLWNYAKANGSDVVVGKEVRPASTRPLGPLFRVNRPNAVLGHDPLLRNLTPHKMFRRVFLLEHDIWFIEGPRRLIDHAYVVEAYFRARVISVLADYVCYHWIAPRPDRSNASLQPHDWHAWYRDLRAVLDVVERHTEPGAFRDVLLSHWYGGSKGLARLGGQLENWSEGRPREFMEALRDVALERFPPSVDAHLPPVAAVRSALLRAGDLDRIEALATAERGMRIQYDVERIVVARGMLHLRLTARLVHADGSPILLERRGGRASWRPPLPLGDAVPDEALDFTRGLRRTQVELLARHAATGERVPLTVTGRVVDAGEDGAGPIEVQDDLRVDLDALGATLAPGRWRLRLQMRSCGWHVTTRLAGVPETGSGAGPRRPVPLHLRVAPSGEVSLGWAKSAAEGQRG